MQYLTFSWIDYVLFSILLIGSMLVGIWFGCVRKEQKSFMHYFLGGKSMATLPVAMSLIASCISSVTLLGVPAEIYLYGSQYWMMWISWIVMGFLTNYIFLPVFYRLQLPTTYEYFELRFDRRVRKVASAMYTIVTITSLPILLYGPSLAFNQVSGFDVHLTAIVIAAICIFYTSIGGLKAVVWADAFQLCCTICTLGIILVMGAVSAGGVSNIWDKARLGDRLEFFNMDPNPTIRTTFWTIVIGHIAAWTNISGVSPSSVQRFLSVPTFRDSKRVLIIFVVLSILTKTISSFSGLILYAKYFDCDPFKSGQIHSPDQIMPYYVMDTASQVPGLSGIFVSGLLSTALSTLSTSLNTLSGTVYKDFVGPFLKPDTTEVTINRILKVIAIVFGIVSVGLIFVVEHLGTIVQVVQSLNGAFNGPLLGLFILGMLCPMANSLGALVGAISTTIIMSIIMIQNQVYVWNGILKNTPKPLYTHGCNESLILQTGPELLVQEKPLWLFRISFFYYGAIGCTLSVIIGLIMSWITKKNARAPIDKKLFSPCIHRLLGNSERYYKEKSLDDLQAGAAFIDEK